MAFVCACGSAGEEVAAARLMKRDGCCRGLSIRFDRDDQPGSRFAGARSSSINGRAMGRRGLVISTEGVADARLRVAARGGHS